MKSLIIILAIGILAYSNAETLDGSTDLFGTLKEAASGLVSQVVEKGKKFLQDSLLKLLPGLIGKREEGDVKKFFTDIISKFQTLLDHGKVGSTALFKKAMDKLKTIAGKFHQKLSQLKDSKEVTDAVDAVVDEHNAVQKRFLSDLVDKAKEVLANAKAAAGNLLAGVKAKASSLVSSLLQRGSDLLVGKRALSFSDHLQTLGGHLQNLVSPFKDVVSNLGNTLKGHFSNLIDTAKGHAVALGNKLKGHLSDLSGHGQKLVEHGKNALSAISEVVKDVLNQTLANAKPSIDGIVKTAGDAGKVVAGHFAGTDSN